MLTLLALLIAVHPPAQIAPSDQTAAIAGRIVDRQGSPLPGTTVTVEAASNAVDGRAVVDSEGNFRVTGLTPGNYTVRFELTGFRTYARQRLSLAAGQTHAMTVALDVGPLAIVDHVGDVPPTAKPTFTLNAGEVAVGVNTTVGTFYIAVDTKRAPITANNFLKYVDAGLYDEGRFHRATRPDNYTPSPPNRPMMNLIQGGINQARRSQGFPPIPLERTSVTGIKHVTGVVSMARGTGADTATSDFFVLLDDQPSLDFGGLRFDDGQGGAAFGHVLSGLDVVRKIQQQPVDGQNLAAPVTIRKVWRVK
jgi:peptidyl-prolyl cis-trans isomerase A (cyclophilin A)